MVFTRIEVRQKSFDVPLGTGHSTSDSNPSGSNCSVCSNCIMCSQNVFGSGFDSSDLAWTWKGAAGHESWTCDPMQSISKHVFEAAPSKVSTGNMRKIDLNFPGSTFCLWSVMLSTSMGTGFWDFCLEAFNCADFAERSHQARSETKSWALTSFSCKNESDSPNTVCHPERARAKEDKTLKEIWAVTQRWCESSMTSFSFKLDLKINHATCWNRLTVSSPEFTSQGVAFEFASTLGKRFLCWCQACQAGCKGSLHN